MEKLWKKKGEPYSSPIRRFIRLVPSMLLKYNTKTKEGNWMSIVASPVPLSRWVRVVEL